MYATDENGTYSIIASTGWNVEEVVTKQALLEFERLADIAYSEVAEGKKSPLFFHMYNMRMDLHTLSRSTGLYQWRIKRHFDPKIFIGLSRKLKSRYSEVLGISISQLISLPKREEKNDR